MLNTTRTISGRWIVMVLLICHFSLSGNAQTANLEIRKLTQQDFLEWNLYDPFDHLVLSGTEFSSDELISTTLKSNRRYILEVIVSDAPPQDSILLTLFIDGQPIILIPGEGLEAGVHTHTFYTGTREQKLKVLGGSDTDISLYPWQVFLVSGNNLCGGSIIGDKWILTAAHCLFNSRGREISPGNIEVVAGATNPFDPAQGEVYYVKNVIIHEDYNTDELGYDLTLLELTEEITVDNAEAIPIVTVEDASLGATDPGVLASLTGWGSVQVDPEVFPETLQQVQLPIVSNNVASKVWGPISPTFLMAGFEDAKKDACSGDSGGPLVVTFEGEYKLAGIVSWGSETCDTYGGYTKVSLFETWIRDHTGIQENDLLASLQGEQLICRGLDSSTYLATMVPGADYQWKLAPPEAGRVEYQDELARVSWDEQYIGTATISARVSLDGELSTWKRLALEVIQQTSLNGQSRDTVLCEKEALKLELQATGHELVYDWYKDGSLWLANTADMINIMEAVPDNSGIYYGIVTGSCGTVKTADIPVTVHPLTGILSQSPDTRANIGALVLLEVAAKGHQLSYQWEKDGMPLPGENFPQLLLNDVNANQTGLYRVNLEGTCGSSTGDSIYLYVSSSGYLEEPDVYIWPTISNALFNVASNLDGSFDLLVYNIHGQLVKRMDDRRYTDLIDLSGKAGGIYLVLVRSGNWTKTMKIRKE